MKESNSIVSNIVSCSRKEYNSSKHKRSQLKNYEYRITLYIGPAKTPFGQSVKYTVLKANQFLNYKRIAFYLELNEEDRIKPIYKNSLYNDELALMLVREQRSGIRSLGLIVLEKYFMKKYIYTKPLKNKSNEKSNIDISRHTSRY